MLLAMQRQVEEVFVDDDIEAYFVSLTGKTRTHTSGCGRRESARIAGAAQAQPRLGCHSGTLVRPA